MKQIRLRITGKVQGVFFRDHARKAAEKLGIVGFVKNMPDSSVLVVGKGKEAQLEKFITECKRGSFVSRIDNVDISYEEPQEFERFSIRY